MDVETVVNRQLSAYNAHDLEGYLACFAADIEVRSFPESEVMTDRSGAAFRGRFEKMFAATPDITATLESRVVHGRFVVDKETIVPGPGVEPRVVTAIYEIEDDRIARMWFVG